MAIRIYYLAARFLTGLWHALSLRATAAGMTALACLAASAVLGMDTTKNAAHEAFTLLAALIAFSLLVNRRFRAPVSVQRTLPRFATAGYAFSYLLVVRNNGGRKLANVTLREHFGDPRPSFPEFRDSVRAGLAKGNHWLKDSMLRNWQSLRDGRTIAEPAPHDLPSLPARVSAELRVELVPLRRGRLRFEALKLGRTDPAGLFRTIRTVPSAGSLLVLPRRYRMPQIRLQGGRKYHQGGISLASHVGDSDEFISLRDYRHGDPLRKIHWKSWARTGRPVVKEHADEFFTRHALVLDTFTDAEDRVFEEALSVASSFLAQVETNDSLLDLLFVGTDAYVFTTGRSIGQAERALEALACSRPCPDKNISTLEALVLGRAALLSSCICVLLSWDEGRQEFVRKLQSLGIPVTVLLVRDGTGSSAPAPGPLSASPGAFHVLETGRIEEGLQAI